MENETIEDSKYLPWKPRKKMPKDIQLVDCALCSFSTNGVINALTAGMISCGPAFTHYLVLPHGTKKREIKSTYPETPDKYYDWYKKQLSSGDK